MISLFYVLVLLNSFFLYLGGVDLQRSIATAIALICFMNYIIAGRIKKRKKLFDATLYKIYRFINMQLDTGLIPSDIIAYLPAAVNDATVKPELEKMSAVYKLTGDIDKAIIEISLSFESRETELFGNHLKQCLETGVAGKAFSQMESLLFSRYISHIKAQNNKVKNLLLFSLICSSIPVIIVMVFPVIQEMIQALNSIWV